MNGLVRLAGALCLVVLVVGGAFLAAGTTKVELTKVQLATSRSAVEEVLATPHDRELARRALAIDYVFIAAYWAAFVTLALVIVRRGGAWTAVGLAAMATATAAAALDVAENLRTAGVIDAVGAGLAQGRIDALRHVSTAKWAASALTVGLLAGVFLQWRWVAAIAAALLVASAIGLLGLRHHGLITVYFDCVAVLTLVIAGLCVFAPGQVTKGFG